LAGMGKKRNTYKYCGEKNLRNEIISMTYGIERRGMDPSGSG